MRLGLPRLSLLAAAALLLASPARSQDVLYSQDGAGAFGAAVAGAGDVDGDGSPDWIVGVPADDVAGNNAGSARVYSGAGGALLHTWDGDDPGDSFGAAVAGAGDVNGDGFDDLIVGTPHDEENGTSSGSARVFSGLDGSLLYSYSGLAFDDLGQSVNGAGDVNGDGFDDFVIGVPGDNAGAPGGGSARVYSGATGSLLYSFTGSEQLELFGYSVDGAGDVNGDGFADIVVGAIGSDANGTQSGLVRVHSGADGSALFDFPGGAAFEQFGHAVSGAGDVNGDGFDDVLGGSTQADNSFGNAGTVRVYSGLDGSLLFAIDGTGPRDYFGASLDGAGDVNGDGHDDFVVGAPVQNTPGTDLGPGSVRLFSGRTGTLLFEVEGLELGDRRGFAVGGVGDVNGDGHPDVVAGTPNAAQGNVLVLGLDRSTWWVDAAAAAGGDGSLGLPFQTIQEGVDAAGDGERVAVRAGTYHENVRVVSGDILIEAVEPGAVIDGGDVAACVFFSTFDYGQGSNQGVRGFTLRNGNTETFGAGGGGVWISQGSATVEDCVIECCHGDFGGGIYAQGGSPILRGVTVRDCFARASFQFSRGGGIMLSHCASALIEACTIEDNRCDNAAANGGGIYVQLCDDLVIRDCRIRRNVTGADGGGIFARLSTIDVESCEISGNSAALGGGIRVDGSSYFVERSLVLTNTANDAAGVFGGSLLHSVVYGNEGVGVANSSGVLNSIVWANTGGSLSNTSSVSYSNVEGVVSGPGNLDAEPGFIDARNDNYHLAPGSPCIDAGDPASAPDFDGTRADMGAFPFADCNGNGVDDTFDIAAGSSQDLNLNGFPDECECLVYSYCQTSPHSTGAGATMGFLGTVSTSRNDLTLLANDCPPNKFGLFFYGTQQGQAPFGDGVRCVFGQTFRFTVVNTGAQGVGSYAVDYSNQGQPAGQITPGSRWNFQFWFRDPSGPGGSGFNTSDGLEIVFCP